MWQQMICGLRMTALLTVLTGLIYPGLVTGLCQMLFPVQANGSLITRGGKVVGSFGHPGRNAGQFHWLHQAGMDSKGNLYTGEVDTGKRLQKFILQK